MHKGTLMGAVMKVESITHLISSHLISPPAEAHVSFSLESPLSDGAMRSEAKGTHFAALT